MSDLATTVITTPQEAEPSLTINFDPLAAFDSPSVGNEFVPYVPEGPKRRINELRRDRTIVKNWRGKPMEKSSNATLNLRNGLSNIRDFETKQLVESERMFVIVLAVMSVLLAGILIYFVMNFLL